MGGGAAGSYLRLIDFCRLESNKEEERPPYERRRGGGRRPPLRRRRRLGLSPMLSTLGGGGAGVSILRILVCLVIYDSG